MYPAVVLSAGESSRFWPLNHRYKALFYLMGKPLIWWTLKGVEEAGIKKVIIIQSPKMDIQAELRSFKFKKLKIKYLIQERPLGSGNALWQARPYLTKPFFVLNADVLCSKEILLAMMEKIRKEKKPILAGQKTETPWLFGIMDLQGERILRIVEKPKKGKEPSKIKVVGVYFLEPDYFDFYRKVKKHHYDFEDALSKYMEKREVMVALIEKPEKETPSFLKYPWHLFNLRKYLFDKFLKRKIDKSVKMAKNVVIEGKVFIGRNTKIFEGAVIKGPCYIGENCLIGNNSLIREYTNLENNVTIGAFCEVTRSIFQENSSTHSGYFGDSIIGRNTKIGAGVITSNLRLDRGEIFSEVKGEKINTGLKSFGTVIGENSRLATKINIMPGKFIGSYCFVGPSLVIFENIDDGVKFIKKVRASKE